MAATCIITRVTVTMVNSTVPREDAADWSGFDLTEYHGCFGGLKGFNCFGGKPERKSTYNRLVLEGNIIVKGPTAQ